MALLPLMNPITADTECFGGIDTSIWTWSGIRWPSSTRLSFWDASLRNTSPRCTRNCPHSVLRRHLGMNTTWYLHSHAVWLKLSYLSIVVALLSCAWRLTRGSFHDGHPWRCQTFAASPAEPGGLPL